MLLGRYVDSSLRPFVDAHVRIPSIGAGGFVSFLIDTGADCTTITPADAKRLRIDYRKLVKEDHAMGYNGVTVDFLCDAIITFTEIGVVEYEYDIALRVTKPDPLMPELFILPSLLGRDILNQWRMTFDPAARAIKAEILSCSRTTAT